MWWSRKKRRHADQKARKVSGPKEPMIMTVQRIVVQSVKQTWDCSQIEHEEEEEDEDWQKGDQMELQ